MEPPGEIVSLHGDDPSQTGRPSTGQNPPSTVPDVTALLGALRDSVASEDRAEEQVLSKTRNVAAVASAFFALSQSAVFSTDILTTSESPWTGIVIVSAVVALACLGWAIFKVVRQQQPEEHPSLPTEEIGRDLLDVLYSDSGSEADRLKREREATRALAQHYAGLKKAKGARTKSMAEDYGAVAKFCLLAVAVTAFEFTVAVVSQAL